MWNLPVDEIFEKLAVGFFSTTATFVVSKLGLLVLQTILCFELSKKQNSPLELTQRVTPLSSVVQSKSLISAAYSALAAAFSASAGITRAVLVSGFA
jgi:hypothetical protein